VSDLPTVARVFGARKSVRAFRPEPVPRERLEAVFAAAQTAPSWCNTQPWRVAITEPPRTALVSAALVAAARSELPSADVPFPLDYPEPYLSHRRACGFALYGAMGIPRDDKTRRYDAWLRNYQVFDAPHLAVVAVDKRLGPYALIDIGVWLGHLLPALTADGLAACAMASIAAYPKVLRRELPSLAADELQILFGIAIGFEDTTSPTNQFRTERQGIANNVTFVG
jgi:nitroreductase